MVLPLQRKSTHEGRHDPHATQGASKELVADDTTLAGQVNNLVVGTDNPAFLTLDNVEGLAGTAVFPSAC